MDQPTYGPGLTIRTIPAARRCLARAVADLKASSIEFFGGKVSQEAVVNALWLWMEDMPPADLEEAMATYIPKLEAIMRQTAKSSPEQPNAQPQPRRAKVVDPDTGADITPRGSTRKRKSS